MKFLRHILMIFVVLCSIGCSTPRYITVQGENKVITEYKEIIKDSIVYVPIEKDSSVNNLDAHRDTLSILTNRYSESKAEIKSGKLKHSLKTKSNDSIKVKIVYKDIIKTDSVYIEKPVIQEVEKPIRDNIFWYSIIGNVIFIALLGFKFARTIKKFISL